MKKQYTTPIIEMSEMLATTNLMALSLLDNPANESEILSSDRNAIVDITDSEVLFDDFIK